MHLYIKQYNSTLEKQELIDLLIKYREMNLSESELESLKVFLAHEHTNNLLIEALEEISPPQKSIHISVEKQEKMFSEIWNETQPIAAPKPLWKKYNKLIIVTMTAAALFLIIPHLNIRLNFNRKTNESLNPKFANTHHIIPGSAKATLVLDNGKTLDLGNLHNDTTILLSGYAIHKDKKGELSYILTAGSNTNEKRYNTIITPKGGEYQLSLPDGTSVWVNSSTRLKYPLQFDKSKREVELEGEAYFEVAKLKNNEKHIPFFIYTGSQILEVLGTTFNINSYSKAIQTTLIEGKVKLIYPGQKEYYLTPNQQATFTEDANKLDIKEVDPLYFTAWKNGVFAFDNASIQDVMDKLSRWYEIEITYKADVSDLKFSGTISKYEQIDKVLRLIEMTGSVRFKIEERRVIVMK